MILSRTPLRISLFGGGTDLPSYSETFGGQVINFTIDKYIYVILNKKFDNDIRLSYSVTENISTVSEIKHSIVRNAFTKYAISGGVELVSIADIPSNGSGLGSSSAFTVGVVNSLQKFLGNEIPKEKLAEEACDIEIRMCANLIGKQDQYSCAFGGFNQIKFKPDSQVEVKPITVSNEIKKILHSTLMLFYTKTDRRATKILSEQDYLTKTNKGVQMNLHKMKEIAELAADRLMEGDIEELGNLMTQSWTLKKTLNSHVTTREIEANLKIALKSGALGGKLLGAGAGGFFLILAPQDKQAEIESKLQNWSRITFNFDDFGSQLLRINEG